MNPDLTYMSYMLLALPITIVLHELGHYLPAKAFGWKPRFFFNRDKHIYGVEWKVAHFGKKTRYKLFIASFLSIIGILPYIVLLSYAPTMLSWSATLFIILALSANSLFESVK